MIGVCGVEDECCRGRGYQAEEPRWVSRGHRHIVKFLGLLGRGTGSQYAVRYSREIFTLRVENKPGSGSMNPGRRSKVVNLFYVTMAMISPKGLLVFLDSECSYITLLFEEF